MSDFLFQHINNLSNNFHYLLDQVLKFQVSHDLFQVYLSNFISFLCFKHMHSVHTCTHTHALGVKGFLNPKPLFTLISPLEMSSSPPLCHPSRLSSSLTSRRGIPWSEPVRPPLTRPWILFNAYTTKLPMISLPSSMAPGRGQYAGLSCFFHSTQSSTTHTAQQHATNICRIKRIKEWK